MKQRQYSPLTVAEMAVSLYAVNEGYLDDVPSEKVVDFEAALHSHARANAQDLLEKINSSGDYDDDVQEGLKSLVDGFKETGAY